MTITVVLIKGTPEGFAAFIPALPGCISQGETRDEAMTNMRSALELYLTRFGDDIKSDKEYELVELQL